MESLAIFNGSEDFFLLKAMSRRILINIKKKNQSQARIAFYWIIADVGVEKKVIS